MTAPCHFSALPTGETGIHTGRPRYRVECLTCGIVLHEATTGPVENINRHLREVAAPTCAKGLCGKPATRLASYLGGAERTVVAIMPSCDEHGTNPTYPLSEMSRCR